MSEQVLCAFRDMNPDTDLDFVMSSWLQSFKSSHYAGMIPNNQYWDVYQSAIDQLLDREGVSVRIACNPSNHDQIFGYIVTETGFDMPVVHWVYVKHPFRRNGLCRALITDAEIPSGQPFYYTYKTMDTRHLVAYDTGPFPLAKHKPQLARREKNANPTQKRVVSKARQAS